MSDTLQTSRSRTAAQGDAHRAGLEAESEKREGRKRAVGNGLARAAIRFRPTAFAGTFAALLLTAVIISVCSVLMESGSARPAPPQRYVDAPVVVTADQRSVLTIGSGEHTTDLAVEVADRARTDAALVDSIEAAPGVAMVVPDVVFPVRLDGADEVTAQGWGAHALTGVELVDGRAPGEGEVVVDQTMVRSTGLDIGGQVSLTVPEGERRFTVSGVAEASAAGAGVSPSGGSADSDSGTSAVWFSDVAAPELAGYSGKADAIAVLPEDGVTDSELADAVRVAVGGSAEVHVGEERAAVADPDVIGYDADVLTWLGGTFAGLALPVAVFTAVGTVALGVVQRRREFALLRTIGATPKQIRRAVAAETTLVAPAAGLLGCLPGIALAGWWLGELQSLGAVRADVELYFSWITPVAAVGGVVACALATGWIAAHRPARLKPGAALAEASVERTRPSVVRTALGLAVLTAGLLRVPAPTAALFADAVGEAFATVTLFVFAIAFLGPWLARLSVALFELPLRAVGVGGELAFANTRANTGRMASVITPITLATALTSVLVFTATSQDHAYTEQQGVGITADHVVSHAGGLPADVASRASELPDVDVAVGVMSASVQLPIDDWLRNVSAQAVSGAGLQQVQDLDVTGGDPDRVGQPDTVAFDAHLARTTGLEVGDRIELRLPDGTEVRPRLVAVYDRGHGLGQVTMARSDLEGHVTAPYDSYVLVSGGSVDDLAELGGTDTTVTGATGYAEQRDGGVELNRWAMTMMAVMLGGFSAIAAANTLVMTVLDRRGEFGALRLIGATRRQTLAMVRWEGVLAGVVGLALGSAIAAAVLIPMTNDLTGAAPYVPPLAAAALAAAALALGVLGSVLPARAVLRGR